MSENKTKIKIDGEEVIIDLDDADENDMKDWNIHFGDGNSAFTWHRKKKRWQKKLMGIIPLLSLMAFFLLGFFVEGAWRWCWTVFLAVPVFSTLISNANKNWQSRLRSFVSLITIVAILLIGFLLNGWYWCWVLIFIIPIVSVLFDGR